MSATRGRILEPRERRQDLRRHLAVDLHVLLELREQGAHERLDLAPGPAVSGTSRSTSASKCDRVLEVPGDPRARRAFHQHLDRVVGQAEELQDVGDASDLVQVLDGRLLLGLVLLRDEHDPLVGLHREIERADRLLAADEERNDDVGKHHHVTQREDRKNQPLA